MGIAKFITAGNVNSTRESLLRAAAKLKAAANKIATVTGDRRYLDAQYKRLVANINECPSEHIDRAARFLAAFEERFCVPSESVTDGSADE